MAKFVHSLSKKTKDLPKKREHFPEFKKGKAEYVICPVCNSVYYSKAWHHELSGDRHFRETKNIKFVICPADKMIKAKQFEGQIIIENVPVSIKKDLFNLIENMGRRAFGRDPMDRVISIKENKNTVEVLTTENQLAARIAKKIRESFKNKMRGDFKIIHSHREDPMRIVWQNR